MYYSRYKTLHQLNLFINIMTSSHNSPGVIQALLFKAALILPFISTGLYFVSALAFKLSLAFMIKIILLLMVFQFSNLNQTLNKYKIVRKLNFWWEFRSLQKIARNLNHAQTLVVKKLRNVPIDPNESEAKTFNDCRRSFGDKWPFMIKVSRTRDPKVDVGGKKVNMISSYSYLDLGRDPLVQEAAIEAAREYSTGNHGPRMLCGNLEILENLEKKIAGFFRKDAALVFSSGYLACMSAISGVARKGDLLLMDKLCHASLRSGAKLSGAKIVNFKHNDYADAERLINKHKRQYKQLFIVIEGVYSMDGDIGNLPEARRLCDKYKALLIMDEAHSLGVLGKTGRGTEEHYDWKFKADVICGSFTKAIASVGGYITCEQELRDYYTFGATGLVFSAPLSAYHAGAAYKSFEIIENEPERVQQLQKNAEYMRNKFKENNFNIGDSVTCVIPVIFKDTLQAMNLHAYLLEHGFFSSLVMAPACPIDAPRFRITASATLTKEEVDACVNIFIEGRKNVKENPELKELFS